MANSEPYKILVKYPSRERPKSFFEGLNSLYNNLYNTEDVGVLITCDTNDDSMFDRKVIDRIGEYKNAHVIFGNSKSKVDAINRDMDLLPEALKGWDILVVMSDDMRFTFFGWDEIIRSQYNESGLDVLLHLPDNDAKEALATMYIAGRTFYERFGWIYNPVYKSLFCDTELQEVSKQLDKYIFYNCPGVIFHKNPAYGHGTKDKMFLSQQEVGYSIDQDTYNKRKRLNFGL